MRTMEEIEYLNAENDALKKRIKELELALENSREHEKALRKCFEGHRKQIKELEADKLRQENCCESLVNENKRLNEIIISKDMVGAELHNENKDLRHNLEDYKCENEALKQRIKELESSRPKWISVEERFPTTDEYDGVLVDLHEVSDYPIAGVERIRTVQFITDSIEYDADNNCGIFKNVECMEKCWFTKWMPLPPPPTTEESSVIEEGK